MFNHYKPEMSDCRQEEDLTKDFTDTTDKVRDHRARPPWIISTGTTAAQPYLYALFELLKYRNSIARNRFGLLTE
jgi:hypothetical protein